MEPQRIIRLIIMICFALMQEPSAGQTDNRNYTINAPLNTIERMTIHSRVFGKDRTILISLPPGYKDNHARYPVIFFTDGSVSRLNLIKGVAGFLAESNNMPEAIFVGIVHARRNWELTPKANPVQLLDGDTLDPGPDLGGADTLLAFIREELIPSIDKEYRTISSRIYIGHSHGGLFGFYAMVQQPGLFNAYIDIDPSLWWNNASLVDSLGCLLKKNPGFQTSLYISFRGAKVQTPKTKLKKLFKNSSDYQMKFEMLDLLMSETHQSAILPTIVKGLTEIFKPWQLPKDRFGRIDYANLSLQQLRQHYASPILGAVYPLSESTINSLGYGKLYAGNFHEAIEIFRYNIALFPASANTYDSLGEALEKNGLTLDALAAYEKAVATAKVTNDANLEVFQTNRDRVKKILNQ